MRTALLLSLVALSAACGTEPGLTGAYRGASLVVIVVDTLRADALGAYGGRADVSPELDALARRGIVFERVLAPSSWTLPSHGALLTGIQPRRLGLYREGGEALPDGFTTLAEVLRDGGYRTLGATANPTLNAAYGFAQGFDVYIDGWVPWPWMRPEGSQEAGVPPLPPATEVFARLLAALDAEAGRPVYAQVNVMEPHRPGPRLRTGLSQLLRDVAPPDVRDYLLRVRQASVDVGRFVDDVLERAGMEDTLFVITSDHGEGLDSHPSVPRSSRHGILLYESQVRVPLILHARGLEPARIAQQVRLLDVLPTLLELLGVPPPPDLDGRSLLAALAGGRAELPEGVVAETHFRGANKLAVYQDEWSYFLNRDGAAGLNPRELQRRGRHEQGRVSDRIGQQPGVAARLHERLLEWERAHPKAPASRAGAPDAVVQQQLRALGYAE